MILTSIVYNITPSVLILELKAEKSKLFPRSFFFLSLVGCKNIKCKSSFLNQSFWWWPYYFLLVDILGMSSQNYVSLEITINYSVIKWMRDSMAFHLFLSVLIGCFYFFILLALISVVCMHYLLMFKLLCFTIFYCSVCYEVHH